MNLSVEKREHLLSPHAEQEKVYQPRCEAVGSFVKYLEESKLSHHTEVILRKSISCSENKQRIYFTVYVNAVGAV